MQIEMIVTFPVTDDIVGMEVARKTTIRPEHITVRLSGPSLPMEPELMVSGHMLDPRGHYVDRVRIPVPASWMIKYLDAARAAFGRAVNARPESDMPRISQNVPELHIHRASCHGAIGELLCDFPAYGSRGA
jgi:hypothetical protein